MAIRYLQAEGTSHAHLYLYREDGKLLRRLTSDSAGQDFDPIFAPGGETIVFTHEPQEDVREIWSVEPNGRGLKRLDQAPEWYAAAKTAPYFTTDSSEVPTENQPSPTPRVLRAPDDSVELVLRTIPADEEDQGDGEGHGKHYVLRDLKAGTETEMAKLPGFLGLNEVMHLPDDPAPYFFEGKLRCVFFELHLNSTDGTTVFALDLPRARLIRLSPNWAAPFALPGEPAFLTMTENRYVPIPHSPKTANCSYLERWDANFAKIRYAEANSAALCYGASMYRPEQTPRVIVLRKERP